MSGIEVAGLALGMISAIISIIDATHKVYEAVKDEAGLPKSFKKSANKLPLITKLLEDAERYIKAADEATKTAFTPTLEDCNVQATKLQELFEKVMPEEGESRLDRYVKAARVIGKGGRVEDLLGGILSSLQLLAIKFPDVTTSRTKEQLVKAVEEGIEGEPSLPNGFEKMPVYTPYDSGAENNFTTSGIQHKSSGPGIMGFVQNLPLSAISSAHSNGNVHFRVPRTVTSLFTGRTELLGRIQSELCGDTSFTKKQRRFVITGLGGQGKSEICLQVADLLRDDFWGIFWVDIDKPSTAERDFIAIAKSLGSLVESIPEVLQVLATYQRSWLLILDNADDPEFDYQAYFPPGIHGAVLMTSRVAECRRYSPDAFQALESLDKQDSRELLLKAAELASEYCPAYDSQAEEVVNLLGSHTLALIQAGAYISQGHCQLRQYPEVYKRQRQRLLKFRPKQAQSRYRDVYATFEASADVLEQSESESASDALRLLEVLSMLDSSQLPFQIFEEAWKGSRTISQATYETRDIGELSQEHISQLPSFLIPGEDEWDSFRLTGASSLLTSLSLVTRQDVEGEVILSMHLLTHAWAKDRQDTMRQGVAWIATGCILGLSQSSAYLWQTQERRLLPHILSYLEIELKKAFSLSSTAVVASLFVECGRALLLIGQRSRLDQLLQDMFLELRQDVNEPSKEFLSLYDLQDKILLSLGKNEEAMSLSEQILAIQEEVLGKTHPMTLVTMNNIAVILFKQGKYAEAEAMHRQTLKIWGKVLGKTDPRMLVTMNNLAILLNNQGSYAEAEAVNRQTLGIQGEVLGKTHPDTLKTMETLAIVLSNQRKYAEAEAIHRQMLKIWGKVLGKTDPRMLVTMNNLAILLNNQGSYAEAEAVNRQTLGIQGEVLGKTHPDTLKTMETLAIVLSNQRKYAEAEAMSRQMLEIEEKMLGKTYADTLASVLWLAYLLVGSQEFEEASLLYQRACTGFKLSLGPEHPITKKFVDDFSIVLRRFQRRSNSRLATDIAMHT